MWAQDAGAMYGYAGSVGGRDESDTVQPRRSRPLTPVVWTAQAAAVTQATGTSAGCNTQSGSHQLTSAIPRRCKASRHPRRRRPQPQRRRPRVLRAARHAARGLIGVDTARHLLESVWGPTANIWNTISLDRRFYTPAQVRSGHHRVHLLGSGGGARPRRGRELGFGRGSVPGWGQPLTRPLTGLGWFGGCGGLGNGVSAGSAGQPRWGRCRYRRAGRQPPQWQVRSAARWAARR